MIKTIEHISGSFLNSYEYDKQQFIDNYVYWIKTPDNKHFQFGRDYEQIQAETIYKDLKQQIEIRQDIEWYEILWYVDFWNDDIWIECKTKNWRWSEKDIRSSWQFRIYNYFKGDRKFFIHQYNKKQQKHKVQEIVFEDKEFIPELRCKIKEIEEFLQPYWVIIWKNLKK